MSGAGPLGGDPEEYLGRSDVRLALNAETSPNAVYHLAIGNNGYPQYTLEYAACNDHAAPGADSMIQVYQDIVSVASAKGTPFNIIVSSGVVDPVVSMKGTEKAVKKIGFPLAQGGDRRPWFFHSTATDTATLVQKPPNWGENLHAQDAGVQVRGMGCGVVCGLCVCVYERRRGGAGGCR